MLLGREIVASVLREQNIKPFQNAGLTADSLNDPESLTIFTDKDRDAYRFLLSHWSKHKKTPSLDLFQLSFPTASYRIPNTKYTTDELLELVDEDRARIASELAAMEIAEAVEEGRYADAEEAARAYAQRIRNARVSKDLHLAWDDPEYDIEVDIARVIHEGVFTGINEIDCEFAGFQPGSLITYLGRAKAGKTSFALKSAIDAWQRDKKVLFLTVEITARGVFDRLNAFSSGISYGDLVKGELVHGDKDALREFRTDLEGTDQNFNIVQPTSRYTLTDLEYDIERYQPDVVFVDGFYFLIDRNTGGSGGTWEGHDNLARELKEIALRSNIVVITTHQVREKQLGSKRGKGIDDHAIMGGTGLIMASDMVLGFDIDDQGINTVNCTRSRTGYLHTVKGRWDWNRCVFLVTEVPSAASSTSNQQFAYAGAGNND